jgi:diaminohydroxyphosphoribosylaminopyrimidine deaminase/5-amino-6-(5-phosphoribosylamino)uracil reductase
MNDSFFMRLAVDEAWRYQLLTYPNPAVGAAVVRNGALLAVEAHRKAGESHAEVAALVRAYERISGEKAPCDAYDAHRAHSFLRTLPQGFFSACEIYVTLEPCAHEGKTPSCASLLEALRLKRVVIGTEDPVAGHGGGAKRLQNVTAGIEREACERLIAPFCIWQKRAFVLFKLAQTTNGRIGGGVISSETSRTHVHRLREVCDTLLIGGDTVRIDRPRLDCRLIKGKAPDIHIYTRKDDIDRAIPLFSVPHRKVSIGTDLDYFDKPGFIMVEGGEGMLRALQNRIDWFLIYQAPKLSTNSLSYNIDRQLRFLHAVQEEEDLRIWSAWRGD